MFKSSQKSPDQIKDLVKTHGTPEVHFHTAITLVWPSLDPLSIKIEERNQIEVEIGQFAAVHKGRFYSTLQTVRVAQIFVEFKECVVRRLRDYGALRAGE